MKKSILSTLALSALLLTGCTDFRNVPQKKVGEASETTELKAKSKEKYESTTEEKVDLNNIQLEEPEYFNLTVDQLPELISSLDEEVGKTISYSGPDMMYTWEYAWDDGSRIIVHAIIAIGHSKNVRAFHIYSGDSLYSTGKDGGEQAQARALHVRLLKELMERFPSFGNANDAIVEALDEQVVFNNGYYLFEWAGIHEPYDQAYFFSLFGAEPNYEDDLDFFGVEPTEDSSQI